MSKTYPKLVLANFSSYEHFMAKVKVTGENRIPLFEDVSGLKIPFSTFREGWEAYEKHDIVALVDCPANYYTPLDRMIQQRGVDRLPLNAFDTFEEFEAAALAGGSFRLPLFEDEGGKTEMYLNLRNGWDAYIHEDFVVALSAVPKHLQRRADLDPEWMTNPHGPAVCPPPIHTEKPFNVATPPQGGSGVPAMPGSFAIPAVPPVKLNTYAIRLTAEVRVECEAVRYEINQNGDLTFFDKFGSPIRSLASGVWTRVNRKED